MKQLYFLTILFSSVLCVSSYAHESINKDRHTKERIIRFLNSQISRFESFIKRLDNQERLTSETKQKLLDIQTTILNLKNATKAELKPPTESIEEKVSIKDGIEHQEMLIEENYE